MPVYNLITFGSVALSCVYTGFNDTRHSGGTASRVNASTLLALHSMTTSNVLKHRVCCVRVADNFSLRILWCNNCTHCTVIWQRCTDAPTRRCRTITSWADLGEWLGWLVTPLARQPISCYFYACDLSYFDVVLCPSSSQILTTPLHQEVTFS